MIAYSRMEAAEQASISHDVIDRAIRDGSLRAKKVGRRTIIFAKDLEAWLDSMENA